MNPNYFFVSKTKSINHQGFDVCVSELGRYEETIFAEHLCRICAQNFPHMVSIGDITVLMSQKRALRK